MFYATLVALMLAGAGWVTERVANAYRVASRWIWAAAICGSCAVPVFAELTRGSQPRTTIAASIPLAAAPVEVAPGPTAAFPGEGGLQQVRVRLSELPTLLGVPSLPSRLNPLAIGAWLILSGVLLAALLRSLLALHRARAKWRAERMDGRDVLVSDALGPALVGVVRPEIVMPRWALRLTPKERELMLRHEEEHRSAGDAPLLLFGLLLLVALPWNLPLWWQLTRLRLAVEVDCDRRVLRGGGDLRRYATLLVEIGRRRAAPPMSVALAEPASFLERRIRMITAHPKPRLLRSAASILAAALLIAAVGQVEAPAPIVTGMQSVAEGPAALAQTEEPTSPPLGPDAGLPKVAAPRAPSEPDSDAPRAPSEPDSDSPPSPAATPAAAEPEAAAGSPPALVAQIRGRVTDVATGQPLADARVYLAAGNVAAVSSASGDYSLLDVPAGTHEMRVERAGYAPASRVVALSDGAVLETDFALAAAVAEPQRIRLRGTARVTGRVTAPEGAPLADVQVYLVGENLGAITRQTGVYLILNIPPGTYTLRAERIGLLPKEQQVTVIEGEPLEVDFVLDAGEGATDALDYVRGASNRSDSPPMIYIDGVLQPRSSGASPETLQNLNPDLIDRIEVIKGSAAVGLYGPEAAAGVIQIFTKRRPPG
jgi:hypothetical protein